MDGSGFDIQERPTEYLFFHTVNGELIQVSSTGLTVKGDPDELEYMRSANFSELTDNSQFLAALSVARNYAEKHGLELGEEVVYFD